MADVPSGLSLTPPTEAKKKPTGSEDEGIICLRNGGTFLLDYEASHCGWQNSS
jgi:hypothetical protein